MACKTIAAINNKGGVGKTTTCCILADYFYHVKKMRVLLIDIDGQINATQAFIGKVNDDSPRPHAPLHPEIDLNNPEDQDFNNPSCITDLYYGKAVAPYSTAFGPKDGDEDGPCIDIIPCNPYDLEQIMEAIDSGERPIVTDTMGRQLSMAIPKQVIVSRLAEFCSEEALSEHYDVIILDAAPGINSFFTAVIQASTHVVCPYEPASFSISGMAALSNIIMDCNANRLGRTEHIEFIGMLPTRVDLRYDDDVAAVHACIDAAGDKHFPDDAFFSLSKQYSRRTQLDRPEKQPTVFHLPPSNPVHGRARKVCDHIYSRMFGDS